MDTRHLLLILCAVVALGPYTLLVILQIILILQGLHLTWPNYAGPFLPAIVSPTHSSGSEPQTRTSAIGFIH